MSRRRRNSYSSNSSGGRSVSSSLFRIMLYLVILGGVGGVTWVALTPMEPPVQQVVREIPDARLGVPVADGDGSAG